MINVRLTDDGRTDGPDPGVGEIVALVDVIVCERAIECTISKSRR